MGGYDFDGPVEQRIPTHWAASIGPEYRELTLNIHIPRPTAGGGGACSKALHFPEISFSGTIQYIDVDDNLYVVCVCYIFYILQQIDLLIIPRVITKMRIHARDIIKVVANELPPLIHGFYLYYPQIVFLCFTGKIG